MQLQPLVALIIGLSVTLIICFTFDSVRTERCTVIITGESVKFLGCEFTRDFIDFAIQAKPFGSL
uniref:Movement protein TGBp3 n=1 Tax=Shallot latent virus TaxID=12172 RepID=E9LRT8_9VIRU|nr:TGB3 [Shallot latent virus]ADW08677.1 TGB3 [Shallot latent virus]